MEPIRCIVIDDEPLAVSLLENYISKIPSLSLVKSFTNPIEALQFIQSNSCDLLFLDIQMPELNGIQLMKILGNKTKIILTTAYPEFALDGFENDAIDYLLKPISFERFTTAIEKVKARATAPVPVSQDDFIFIKTEHRLQKVSLDEILYLEGLRDYVAVHLAGKKKILTLQSLRSFEDFLPPNKFMRIHKSHIVALDKIDFVERGIVYINEAPLAISDSYREKFMERISA